MHMQVDGVLAWPDWQAGGRLGNQNRRFHWSLGNICPNEVTCLPDRPGLLGPSVEVLGPYSVAYYGQWCLFCMV